MTPKKKTEERVTDVTKVTPKKSTEKPPKTPPKVTETAGPVGVGGLSNARQADLLGQPGFQGQVAAAAFQAAVSIISANVPNADPVIQLRRTALLGQIVTDPMKVIIPMARLVLSQAPSEPISDAQMNTTLTNMSLFDGLANQLYRTLTP